MIPAPSPRTARLTLAFEALPPPVEPSVESEAVLVATSAGGCKARIRYTSDGPTALHLTRIDDGEPVLHGSLPQAERDALAAWAVEFWRSLTERPAMVVAEPLPAVRVAPEPRMRRPDGRYRMVAS